MNLRMFKGPMKHWLQGVGMLCLRISVCHSMASDTENDDPRAIVCHLEGKWGKFKGKIHC